MSARQVERNDCRGVDLCCVNCEQPLGGTHDVLCYLYAQKRQAERRAVPIPSDPDERAALASFAGLTDDERAAIDQWCFDEEQKRQRGVLLSDTESRESSTGSQK